MQAFILTSRVPYFGDDDTDPGTPDTGAGDKTFTQEQLDKIVQERLNRDRANRKGEDRKLLTKLQELETQFKITDDERNQLKGEIEELEKRTMTAEEIRKKEEAKAKQKYEQDLTTAKQTAEQWQHRYIDSTINNEISVAAQQHGVLGNSLPFVEAFLKPRTKLVEKTDDSGNVIGFSSQVEFQDTDEHGNPEVKELTVTEAIKRMRELPDQYGNLFDKNKSGGMGGQHGTGAAKTGYRPGMTMDEYAKLRSEHPELVYGNN